MRLLESFFDAIVRLEGDALVMHVGEKPYVVTTSSRGDFRGPLAWGQVELSSKPLSLAFVQEILTQILSTDERHTLDEIGAVEHEMAPEALPGERFNIIVARGGDDIWLEVRRRPKEQPKPEPVAPEPAAVPPPAAAEAPAPPAEIAHEPEPEYPQPVRADSAVPELPPEPEVAAEPEVVPVVYDVTAHEDGGPSVHTIKEMPAEEPLHAIGEEMAGGVAEVDAESPILEIYQYDHAAVESSRVVEGAASAAWETPEEVYELSAEDMHGFDIHVPSEPRELSRSAVQEDPAVVAEHELAEDDAFELTAVSEDVLTGQPVASSEPEVEVPDEELTRVADASQPLLAPEPEEAIVEEPAPMTPEPKLVVHERPVVQEPPVPTPEPEPVAYEPPAPEPQIVAAERPSPAAEPVFVAEEPPLAVPVAPTPRTPVEERAPLVAQETVPAVSDQASAAPERPVIVRITRATTDVKAPPEVHASREPMPIEQLIRAAMDAGGSVLYVIADSRPMVRTAGQMRVLKTQPVVTAESIDQFILESGPVREPGASNDATEWEFMMSGAGRVRCVAFHDHNGRGLILHVIPSEISTLEELGVPAAVHEFSEEADGLVIVSGPRSSGKSTLLHALIDRINRTRAAHVITIESRIGFVHETRNSLVSQREVSGDGEGIAAAARSALREGPDILVIDDLRSPEAIAVAIDAARAGRLILGSIAAPSSTGAVERLIEVFAPARRPQVRALLAGILRGVVTQALVRDKSGARVAARELLLSSPAVRQLIADGEFARLDSAIEAGRAHGMMTLSSMLLALVRDGHVEAAEARRHAPDREAFTSMLRRAGLDSSSGERLA